MQINFLNCFIWINFVKKLHKTKYICRKVTRKTIKVTGILYFLKKQLEDWLIKIQITRKNKQIRNFISHLSMVFYWKLPQFYISKNKWNHFQSICHINISLYNKVFDSFKVSLLEFCSTLVTQKILIIYFLFTCLFIYLFSYLFIYSFIHLFIYLFVYLFIYLFVYIDFFILFILWYTITGKSILLNVNYKKIK